MQEKKTGGPIWLERLRNNYEYRTLAAALLSFTVNTAFAGYNAVLGILYNTAWNIGIAVYYILLAIVRALVCKKEINYRKLPDKQADIKRKALFRFQSIMLFAIDFTLIAPITMMVLQQRNVHYSDIHAISIAAFTVCKITVAAVNFAKTRNNFNLSIKIIRNISFVDAMVSVLTLQYTLIMTFGDGIFGTMRTLCILSGFAIWAFLLIFSILSILKTK